VYEWKEELNEWFTSHITPGPVDVDGKVPLVEKGGAREAGFYMAFHVQEGVTGVPYIGHINLELPADDGKALSDQMIIGIYRGRKGRSYSDYDLTLLRNTYNTGLMIPFIDAFGNTQEMDTKAPIDIYEVAWYEQSDPSTNTEFIEIAGLKQFKESSMRLAMTTINGKLIIIFAFEDPANISDTQFLRAILGPLEMVIELPVFPSKAELSKGLPIGYPGDLVSAATGKQVTQKYFELTMSN
jgi:hypothetical protein